MAQNYLEAAKWLTLAAQQGDDVAQNNLGEMYSKGKGIEQNYFEAARWYLSAAEQGLSAECGVPGVA